MDSSRGFGTVHVWHHQVHDDEIGFEVCGKVAPAGAAFDDSPDTVEQVLGLYNRLGGNDPAGTKIVWTDGLEWIVFTRELLLECIGILAEHRDAKLAEAMDDKYFKRVVFSSESTPFKWLSSFADLHDLIGAK